ncbi:MAG: alanine racemase [Oscillospiraceae bacterium]|nr:alanine racemase [Oscillospiraceae bacterium]
MLPKRVYAAINLDNIQKNVRSVMNRLDDDIKIMGIVKANAYGHGAVEVAEAILETGVTDLGVATVGEAVELRRNGITCPILVLGRIFKEDVPLAVKHGVDVTISDIDGAKELWAEATRQGKRAGVYVKIDTGMGRIGFQPNDDGFESIKSIFEMDELKILGAFTHFACADCVDKASANIQRDKFISFTDKITAAGYPLPVRHMYNSAASMELSGYVGDMVRLGVMMYGLYPSEEMNREYKLYPAMEFKSSISFIKDAPKGFTVSYGSTFTTEKATKIATVPVGYGDGYPRYLSNKGEVIIKGVRCPIIGRICMDQFMVDISALPNAVVGDEVTLIGTDGNETITVEDLSDPVYRFNYEFCCLIAGRVPRVYIKNGEVIKIKE